MGASEVRADWIERWTRPRMWVIVLASVLTAVVGSTLRSTFRGHTSAPVTVWQWVGIGLVVVAWIGIALWRALAAGRVVWSVHVVGEPQSADATVLIAREDMNDEVVRIAELERIRIERHFENGVGGPSFVREVVLVPRAPQWPITLGRPELARGDLEVLAAELERVAPELCELVGGRSSVVVVKGP